LVVSAWDNCVAQSARDAAKIKTKFLFIISFGR
jgi:hypothetical protein